MKAVNRSSGLNKQQFEIFGAVAIGLFAFSLTAFLGSSLFSPKDSHAETDISAIIENDGGYTLSATSAQDTVEMSISATPEGTMGVAKNSLNVKSNAPNGYKVFVAMDDATSNDLVKDTSGETTPVTGSIDATSGTFATPATLDLNSWGFAIAKGTTGAPSNNFSTVYNPEVPDKTTMWASMPLKGEDQLLQTINTPDNTTGIDLDVYYGVNADITKPSGVYKGAVTYTAVAMTNAGATEIASISPNRTSKINGGEAMTISTLYTFTAAQAIDASNPITVTIGGKACTGTGTGGAIALADLSNNTDGYLVINCTAPANNSGKYDLNIKIPKYGKDIVISNAVQYWVDTSQASNLCESLSFDPANLKVNAASAYYGQANCDLSDIANLNVYDDQWDDNKTAAQNTADAGLTYDTDAGTLTIEEGYHVEQQVNSQSDYGDFFVGGTAVDIHTLQTISSPASEVLGGLSMSPSIYATVVQNVQANASIYGTYTNRYEFKKECLVYIRTSCTGDGSQYSTMTTDSSNIIRIVTNSGSYKDWLVAGKVGSSVNTTVYSARYGYYYLHTIGC